MTIKANSTSISITEIALVPWAEGDLELLQRLNAPEMLEHLGGPETGEQVLARHKRYVELPLKDKGCMFRIVLLPGMEEAGNIGYWDSNWNNELIYEMGWGVLPEFQGRGIASKAAAAAINKARQEQKHRYVHAFPSVDNPASYAVCRRAGFDFQAECNFEYPPGTIMHCQDWRLDLTAHPGNE